LLKLKATHFLLKEDYNLRLFNEKYYSLHIISTHEIPIGDRKEMENSIKHFLKQFIFKNLLNDCVPEERVADKILDEIVYSFLVCLHTFYTKKKTNTLLIQKYLKQNPLKKDLLDPIDYTEYLKEHETAFLTSTAFFENILGPLFKSLLSNHVKKASDLVDEFNKSIPFIRKSIIFNNEATDSMEYVFDSYRLLLEDEIYRMYDVMGNLDWHILKGSHIGGAFLIAARRAMASNISQSPIIVAEHAKLNKLGFPSYYPINRPTISSDIPKFIVYFGTLNIRIYIFD
jgi:hypothetical protein